jgi:1-deoxy-D-xylulose-5-phosphate reductoisomerase
MNQPTRIAILGSTGSIGRSALEVMANFPERFRVSYLTTHKNIDLLEEQIRHFRPRGVVVLDECNGAVLRKMVNGTTEVFLGEAGLLEVVRRDDVDTVLSALVGFAGLKPTLAAIESGKNIALANKETLVVAGKMVMQKVQQMGVRLVPVDSEHSAILQCLRGENRKEIERIILTASGGPFLNLEKSRFASVTPEQALNHPTWKMGNKITIDSATLMNKGLEVIEAFWLFGVPPEKIEVVIHPQSVIHSMVEFTDGSVKAQLGVPDMKIPIQYALMYPERPLTSYKRVDFSELKQMTFMRPDTDKFQCLALSFQALQMGGSAPTVLNAANEVAVEMFLQGQVSFTAIPSLIENALMNHTPIHEPTLEDLVSIDSTTRERSRQYSSLLSAAR